MDDLATRLSVLLADDEREFVDALAERLEMRGLTAKIVTSGEEVLRVLEEHRVDVAVIDVKMPGMGGIAALKALHETYPHIAVIMLSGHADINTAVSAMDLGAFDYLVKPVQFEELLFRIQDAFLSKKVDGFPG